LRSVLLVSCAICALTSAAHARDLTFVTFGGIFQKNFETAYVKPFSEEEKTPYRMEEWDSELSKLRAQVETGNVSWDIANAQAGDILTGCDEGLFEKIDWSAFANKDDLLPGTMQECGLTGISNAVIIAYDGDKLAEGPRSWADFWDIDKFPGKRGLRYSAYETLEVALLADGVAAADMYKVLATKEGVDRAFAKLNKLKPNIVWWRSGNESMQRLASGEVTMTSAWNARPISVNRADGKNFKIAWQAGGVLESDGLAIVKGTPNKEQALKFLEFFASPEPEAKFFELMPYGGPNSKAYTIAKPDVLKDLPSAPDNIKHLSPVDYRFWADNMDSLTTRFNSWAGN
jgi:putative spermidine/putrescine transport system substrate-binding protein